MEWSEIECSILTGSVVSPLPSSSLSLVPPPPFSPLQTWNGITSLSLVIIPKEKTRGANSNGLLFGISVRLLSLSQQSIMEREREDEVICDSRRNDSMTIHGMIERRMMEMGEGHT